MADRHFPIVTGQFYHIFNRGVARQPIFLSKKDYEQFILALSYYRFKNVPVKLSRFKELSIEERDKLMLKLNEGDNNLIKIICYCLMPNHFHFLVQQNQDNGVATFMAKFANSYTKYFNTKQERNGPILQGVYKAVLIDTDEQLIHLSRYIHINPVVSRLITNEQLFTYPWSSLSDFIRVGTSLLYTDPVLGHFPSIKEYKDFLIDQIDYGTQLEQIKHLLLDD